MLVWNVDGEWHDVGANHCHCNYRCERCGKGTVHASAGYGFYTEECDHCWAPYGEKPLHLLDIDYWPGD